MTVWKTIKISYTVDLIYDDRVETIPNVTAVDHAYDTMILWRKNENPLSVRVPCEARVWGTKVLDERGEQGNG